MKLFKKVLCFAIPLALIVVFALTLVPKAEKVDQTNEPSPSFNAKTDYNGQIAYAESLSGAEDAPESEKGGAYFLAKNSEYTFNGGTISSKYKTYGGAVYVSDGATFTMMAGTIKNCGAKYGGAIYVAKGGTCKITGGTIEKNYAEVAPAIYVEDGGYLEIAETATIHGNFKATPPPTLNAVKERFGGVSFGNQSTMLLDTIYFGHYPQTYVGDELNEKLNDWYVSARPKPVGNYSTKNYSFQSINHPWYAYEYTDGNVYVSGTSQRNQDRRAETYSNLDGSLVKNYKNCWYKLEPIKWFVLRRMNDNCLYLISETALSSGIPFSQARGPASWENACLVRGWLNESFYDSAFSENEKVRIIKMGDDFVRLPTRADVKSGYLALTSDNPRGERVCAPTDFCLANNVIMENVNRDVRAYYRSPQVGTSPYMLMDDLPLYQGYCVDYQGLVTTYQMYEDSLGIRPVIQIMI